jgi:tRNA modification GTPase
MLLSSAPVRRLLRFAASRQFASLGDTLLSSAPVRRLLRFAASRQFASLGDALLGTAVGGGTALGRGRDDGDTIFALSTAPGRGAVAVVRVSGSRSGAALAALCSPRAPAPAERVASLRWLRDPASGAALDSALVLRFAAPASFTGEDAVEVQCHGGRATAAAVLRALGALPGLRPAEPGEFARRAVLGGKLDLVAAEGLADLIDADTDAQRAQALHALSGEPARLFARWRGELVRALALAEAHADFGAEEVDAGGAALAAAVAGVRATADEVAGHLARAARAAELRGGYAVALLGAPNAGKSSLLNALARRDVAIVADTPGTTRDVLEVRLDLRGLPVALADTAGLRAAPADAVEAEGIRRARAAAAAAAVRVCLVDAGELLRRGGDPLAAVADDLAAPGVALLVVSKVDLADAAGGAPALLSALAAQPAATPALAAGRVLLVSAARAAAGGDGGLAPLLDALAAHLAPLAPPDAALVRARHARHARDCLDSLRAFLAQPPERLDLACEDLRYAVASVGRLAGTVGVEEVLDELFAGLCIGK